MFMFGLPGVMQPPQPRGVAPSTQSQPRARAWGGSESKGPAQGELPVTPRTTPSHVRPDTSTFLMEGESFGDIEQMQLAQAKIMRHLEQCDGKFGGSGPGVSGFSASPPSLQRRTLVRVDRASTAQQRAALRTAAREAEGHVQRVEQRVMARTAARQPRAGYDSTKMLVGYASISTPGRNFFVERFTAARADCSEEGRRRAAGLLNKLERIACERECVRLGEGWFHANGGWVQAQVVGVEFKAGDDDSEVELVLRTAGGTNFRWHNGRCRADAPARCCTIL